MRIFILITAIILFSFPGISQSAGATSFKVTSDGNGEIKLLNLSGQPIAIKNATITKGSNMLQLDNLSALSKGVYVAQVSINGVIAGNQKVIKN